MIYQGRDISSLDKDALAILRRDHIGMIYQNFNLISVLTVQENITLPSELAGRSIDRGELKKLLHLLGIENKCDAYPEELSGGQQQRVAIARALLQHPSLILGDELTGNLDHATSEDIMKILIHLNNEFHITILFVTHDMHLAKKAKRMLQLEDGKIIKDEKYL